MTKKERIEKTLALLKDVEALWQERSEGSDEAITLALGFLVMGQECLKAILGAILVEEKEKGAGL